MFFANDIIAAVDRVARVRYLGKRDIKAWNDNRRDGELRLLSGWEWIARNGSAHRQGLKTVSAAYRDAYYELVVGAETPRLRAKLRLVRRAA
jgi:hypothetical protein